MGTGVGSALASARLGLDRVTVIFFGDGAIEEGVFHEALNCASLYLLPVIFVCENNLYASHMPLDLRQHRSEIHEHAIPYGMPGLRIDGNDVFEVKSAASAAIARARAGEGPTLIECMTYRWRGHVGPGWDREFQIRPEAEIEEWIERCPIKRHHRRMLEAGGTDVRIAELDTEIEAEVEEALAFARRSPFPKVEELLNFVYQD
jgi:pyruvate dehydrogenase E1 component alpha subunit